MVRERPDGHVRRVGAVGGVCVRRERAGDRASAFKEKSRAARVLSDGLEARADAMQTLFPEGRVFMLALYGGTWVNVGRGAQPASVRERARLECRRALQLLESPESQRPFSVVAGLPH